MEARIIGIGTSIIIIHLCFNFFMSKRLLKTT